MHAKQRWRGSLQRQCGCHFNRPQAGACTFIVDLPSLDACKLKTTQSRQAPDARGRTRRSIASLVSPRARIVAPACFGVSAVWAPGGGCGVTGFGWKADMVKCWGSNLPASFGRLNDAIRDYLRQVLSSTCRP